MTKEVAVEDLPDYYHVPNLSDFKRVIISCFSVLGFFVVLMLTF